MRPGGLCFDKKTQFNPYLLNLQSPSALQTRVVPWGTRAPSARVSPPSARAREKILDTKTTEGQHTQVARRARATRMAAEEGGLSLVEDCGPYRSKCGYCKARGDASESHGERPKTSARWGESRWRRRRRQAAATRARFPPAPSLVRPSRGLERTSADPCGTQPYLNNSHNKNNRTKKIKNIIKSLILNPVYLRQDLTNLQFLFLFQKNN